MCKKLNRKVYISRYVNAPITMGAKYSTIKEDHEKCENCGVPFEYDQNFMITDYKLCKNCIMEFIEMSRRDVIFYSCVKTC